MRRLIPLAAAAALLAPAGALAAGTTPSSVSIAWNGGATYFSGKVSSSQSVCARNRKVAVYRNRPGADPSVGSTRSSASGNWLLNLSGHPTRGYYYAKAKSTTAGPVGSRTVCAAAKSVVTRAS